MTQQLSEPGAAPDADEVDARRIARSIVRSRVLDDFLQGLGRRGQVSMFTPAEGLEGHLYGALAALRPSDWVFGDGRSSAVALERGLPLRSWLAMMLGTASAAHSGHALPTELAAPACRFSSVSSLMGTQLVHAGGVAHGMKVRGADDVVLAWFGPAAAATGDAHVALNFAGVFETPVIFYFCSSGNAEQDEARLSGSSFAERGPGYGLEAVTVDGANPLQVREAVAAAVQRARSGGGATMIEGRSSADPLLGLGVDEADSEAWSSELRVELGELTEELLAEGPPPLGSLFEHVFAEPTDRLREQAEGLSAHLARFASGEID